MSSEIDTDQIRTRWNLPFVNGQVRAYQGRANKTNLSCPPQVPKILDFRFWVHFCTFVHLCIVMQFIWVNFEDWTDRRSIKFSVGLRHLRNITAHTWLPWANQKLDPQKNNNKNNNKKPSNLRLIAVPAWIIRQGRNLLVNWNKLLFIYIFCYSYLFLSSYSCCFVRKTALAISGKVMLIKQTFYSYLLSFFLSLSLSTSICLLKKKETIIIIKKERKIFLQKFTNSAVVSMFPRSSNLAQLFGI